MEKEEGTIVLPEKRKTIEKIRDWYNKKYIETQKSQKFEENFHRNLELQNKTVNVAGSIARVIVKVLPQESEYRLAAEILADKRILGLKEKVNLLIEKAVLGSKRYIEYNFFKTNGTSENVVLTDLHLVQDSMDTVDKIRNLEDEYKSRGKVA